MAEAAERILTATPDQLLREMECPVCYKPLTPPITMCKNGHNTCGKCRKTVHRCPSCRCELGGSRNYLAEKIFAMLEFPCENADVGCSEIILGSQLLSHERMCPSRIYKCALDTCTWLGRNHQILDHFKDEHAPLVLSRNYGTQNWINPKLDEEDLSCMLISAFNEIFYYFKKVDPGRKCLIVCVQYIGLKEMASEFMYRFEIKSKDEIRTNTYSDVTQDDVQTLDDIIASRKCLLLDLEFVKSFVKNENLVYTLSIISKKSFDF